MVDKQYIRRGAVLDVYLRFRLDGGVSGEVKIVDKAGVLVEGFEYKLDEVVVQKWLASLAAKKLRKVFHL